MTFLVGLTVGLVVAGLVYLERTKVIAELKSLKAIAEAKILEIEAKIKSVV